MVGLISYVPTHGASEFDVKASRIAWEAKLN